MNEVNQRINRWMAPRMPYLIIVCLALGIAVPNVMGKLSPHITALMVFMTFSNTLGGSFRDLGKTLRHPKAVLLCMVSLHVLMPLLALGVGSVLFPNDPLYTLGLVMIEASPAAVSSLLWITIGGGNMELCLSVVLLDALLSPVILPLTLRLLCGSVVTLDSVGMMQDLVVMIVIPAALAMLLCQLKGKETCNRLKGHLSSLSKLSMLLVVAGNITRCVDDLHHLNATLLLVMLATVGMRVLGLILGWTLARLLRYSYKTSLTVTMNSSMRNMAAASTLAAEYFPSQAAFSPSISPLFSQLLASVAVRILQKKRETLKGGKD